jgi:hypothetical protein
VPTLHNSDGSGCGDHRPLLAGGGDAVAGGELAAGPRLDGAVDLDGPAADQVLGLPAAAGEAGRLDRVGQGDVVAQNGKVFMSVRSVGDQACGFLGMVYSPVVTPAWAWV